MCVRERESLYVTYERHAGMLKERILPTVSVLMIISGANYSWVFILLAGLRVSNMNDYGYITISSLSMPMTWLSYHYTQIIPDLSPFLSFNPFHLYFNLQSKSWVVSTIWISCYCTQPPLSGSQWSPHLELTLTVTLDGISSFLSQPSFWSQLLQPGPFLLSKSHDRWS